MVKCPVTTKSFPWGKLACEARLKRAAVGSYFMHILRRIRTMYHFASRFTVSFCVPPPSFAPASRGTFPQGKVLAGNFSLYYSTGVMHCFGARRPPSVSLNRLTASPGGSRGVVTFGRSHSTCPGQKRTWVGRMISSPTGTRREKARDFLRSRAFNDAL